MSSDSTHSKTKKPPLPTSLSSLGRANSITVNRSTLNDILNPSSASSSFSSNYLEIPDAATPYYSSYKSPSTSSMIYGGTMSSSSSASPTSRCKNFTDNIKMKSTSPTFYRKIGNEPPLPSTPVLSTKSPNYDSLKVKLERKLNSTPSTPNTSTPIGRSSRSSFLSQSFNSKKKKFQSTLSAPSAFLHRKRHSIESLIGFCKNIP